MLAYPEDFGVTEEHAMLRKAARSFLQERSPRSAVRRLVESGARWDRDVWRAMDELGWLGVLVPEDEGGAGLGHLHLAILLEETGRALLPSPLLVSTLATMVSGERATASCRCASSSRPSQARAGVRSVRSSRATGRWRSRSRTSSCSAS